MKVPIHIPMTVKYDWSDGLSTDHTLDVPSVLGYGKRFGIGSVPKGGEARKKHGGPMVPGPWAYTFGLATVIASNPAMSTGAESRRKKAEGTEHMVAEGDLLEIDGYVYSIKFTNGFGVKTGSKYDEFIELVPVEG